MNHYSSDDMLALVAELNERRIGMVLHNRLKRLSAGQPLLLTPYMDHKLNNRQMEMVAIARKLHHRYSQGRYFHTDEELTTIRDLAYWLVHEHQLNQPLSKPVKFLFNEANMRAAMPPPPGRYRQYIQRVLNG